MARYAQMARTYWETFLPSQVATMDDPAAFFASLSDQVEEQIEQTLLTPPYVPKGATSEQVIAAHQAQLQEATESALQDLVFLPPEPGTEDKRQPGTVLAGWETQPEAETPSP